MSPPARLAAPADAPELLERVELLELVARRSAAGLLSGDYETFVRGQGLIFHEARSTCRAIPVRSIDWNVTARLGEPYVKVNLEERQRDVFVAVDVSPSMHSGFQQRTKLELAVELAATLGVAAIEGGDRLGWVLFADRALAVERPQGGRRQLFRFLRALLERTWPWERPVAESDPRAAVHAIQGSRRGRFVVFLISDFVDHDVPEDLRYLRPQHDVSLLHVYDPIELEPGSPVVLTGYSPEALASPQRASPGSHDDTAAFLRREAARMRLTTKSFSTAEPVAGALGELFHHKSRARG